MKYNVFFQDKLIDTIDAENDEEAKDTATSNLSTSCIAKATYDGKQVYVDDGEIANQEAQDFHDWATGQLKIVEVKA